MVTNISLKNIVTNYSLKAWLPKLFTQNVASSISLKSW